MTPPDFKDPESDKTSVRLTAKLPYADIKISLKGKGARISAFGKRALLLGVPAFLDESLKPWREHLERATTGQGSLEKALEVRVLRDAHALLLEGKKQVNDLRRLYPVGLSPQAAEEIMRNMNGALRRLTRTARLVAAAACVAASTGLFVGLFLTSFPTRLTARLKLPVALSLDALIALLAVGLSWLALTQSARWALQRETPGRKVTTKPNIGKLGYGALAAIAAIYLLLLAHARLQLF
ncbi:MAG: hypothetical protein HGA90_01945 [Alphaproteobacteria bacterium]|nr:hypothetical protein [Alphaproteobacteria bacterium]